MKARILLCAKCAEYTLHEACHRCGSQAIPNRPARYSPEDRFGSYRRQMKALAGAP